jgi:copper oxidase (laccase) domain-containing protein
MMAEKFGSRPADLHAAIGPSIGACCYEVGPEVAEQFGKQGRIHIDLPDELVKQLQNAGLSPEQIYRGDFCTRCQPDQFWSYRREGEAAGRMWSGASVSSSM